MREPGEGGRRGGWVLGERGREGKGGMHCLHFLFSRLLIRK